MGESGVDWRDHRLDLLEKVVGSLEKRVDQLQIEVNSLNARSIFQRDLTPLERQIITDQFTKSLAQSVERHYTEPIDRRRRARIGLLATLMGGAAAVGAFIAKLIGSIRFHF